MWRSRFTIGDALLPGTRCSHEALDFLSTTDVGRLVPAPASKDVQSEAPEGTPGAEEKGEERSVAAEGLGAEEQPRILPTPSFMAPADGYVGDSR